MLSLPPSVRVFVCLLPVDMRRSEKIDPAQLLLFAEAAMKDAAPEATLDAEAQPVEPKPKKKGHGRKKPPVELPRLPIEHPVAEADKVCPHCGDARVRIGEEITEQLEYAPASLFVIEHIQPKLACRRCEEGVVLAPKPAQPIEKGLPGPGLLAHVVVSKYCDHLPLYRQESIFERHGLELSRQTMCGWVLASAQILEPVVEAMKVRILESKVIHTDDTPVTVREPGRSGTHQGRFWVYLTVCQITTNCGDGDLAIDNNLAENALRGIAVGRKNWLFAGSDHSLSPLDKLCGGRAAAVLYSLITVCQITTNCGSAKRHDLDPFIYLRDLFLRIPTHPNKDLHQLLADCWKRDILPTLTTPPTL